LSFQFLESRFFVTNNRPLVLYKISHFHTRLRVPVLDGENFAYLPQREPRGLGAFYKRQAIDRGFPRISCSPMGSSMAEPAILPARKNARFPG